MRQISFCSLLREIIALTRNGRLYSTRVRPNLSTVLREALTDHIPKEAGRLELSTMEFLFLATVAIEGTPCRDTSASFAKVWSMSEEEKLLSEFQIRISVREGKLKAFLTEDRDGYAVRDEKQKAVLAVLLGEEELAKAELK